MICLSDKSLSLLKEYENETTLVLEKFEQTLSIIEVLLLKDFISDNSGIINSEYIDKVYTLLGTHLVKKNTSIFEPRLKTVRTNLINSLNQDEFNCHIFEEKKALNDLIQVLEGKKVSESLSSFLISSKKNFLEEASFITLPRTKNLESISNKQQKQIESKDSPKQSSLNENSQEEVIDIEMPSDSSERTSEQTKVANDLTPTLKEIEKQLDALDDDTVDKEDLDLQANKDRTLQSLKKIDELFDTVNGEQTDINADKKKKKKSFFKRNK